MKTLREIFTVIALSLKSLPQRPVSSAVIVIGIAGVVAVLLSMLSMSTSLVRAISAVGDSTRAIVLADGAFSEGASSLSRQAAIAIQNAPGIQRTPDDKPLASAEVVAIAPLQRKSDGGRAEGLLRGVNPLVLQALRPEIKVSAGRAMQPGLNELIVGRAAQRQFSTLNVGDRVTIRNVSWTIVGVFESGGDARESELLADAEALQSAFKLNGYNAVTVRLDSAASFDRFKAALTADAALSIRVLLEPEYYRQQSMPLRLMFSLLAYVIGGIMAIGAMLGAVNTMSSAITSRNTEIATLRAIGFNAVSVVCAVLAEALLLGLIGATLGVALVWIFIGGSTFNTRSEDGALVVQLQLTVGLVMTGISWACVIGAIGGLVPAIRVARLPVATALRET